MVENKRSVFAGGAFTIGAWNGIFENVANDLVREIKTRINGGGFMVSLLPYAEQPSEAVQTRNPLEIEVKNISDLREEKLRLGERAAAFSVKMSDIYPNRRAAEYLAETLSDALRTMGHKVGPSANGVTVQGELHKFRNNGGQVLINKSWAVNRRAWHDLYESNNQVRYTTISKVVSGRKKK